MAYDKLILAVGSKPNKFGWPGQDLPGVQGLYSAQDLDELENNSINAKRAVIVGGGLIGIEMAEMLLSRGIAVTFFVREKSFWWRRITHYCFLSISYMAPTHIMKLFDRSFDRFAFDRHRTYFIMICQIREIKSKTEWFHIIPL